MEQEFVCKQFEGVALPTGEMPSEEFDKFFKYGGCVGCPHLLDCEDLQSVCDGFLLNWARFGHEENKVEFFEEKVDLLSQYIVDKIDQLFTNCDEFAEDWVNSVYDGPDDEYKKFLKIIKEWVVGEIEYRIDWFK